MDQTRQLPVQRNIFQKVLLSTIILLLLPVGVGAQETAPEVLPVAPIALAEIPSRAVASSALLDQSEILLARSSIFDAIASELLLRERAIANRAISLNTSLAAASSREAIAELEQGWLELERALVGWEEELQNRSIVIGQQLSLLDARLTVWRQTVQESQAANAPDELVSLAQATADELGTARSSLGQMEDRVLALQGRVGRAHASVREALGRVAAEEADLLRNLMRRDRSPLWTETLTGVSAGELGARAQNALAEWWSTIYLVIRGEPDRVVFQLLLILVISLVLRRTRQSARAWTASDPSFASGMSVFERPVALAAVLALMLTPWIYISTLAAVDDAVALLLVLPVLRLLLPLLDKPVRPALFMLAVLYVIDQLRDLVEAAPLVARLIFVFEMIAAIALVVWLLRSRALYGDSGGAWWDRIHFGLKAVLVLLVVAALAATAGFLRLAVLIGYGVLNAAYLALFLVAILRAVDAVVALTLHSRALHVFRVVSTRALVFRRQFKKIFGITAVAIWVYFTLDFFALRDFVIAFASGVIFAELQTGAIAISIADVLAFVVTIYAAILLARWLTIILEEDVYSRVQLGRGVPFAISKTVKYSIISLGFLLAVGAMGIGMDRITILLGAFGVGLGFGLQNVVNNFVSGLILVFERPVQVGDSVIISSVSGTIKRIGIRSSTIRSFDGADITIPNGNLLSDPLTNWTMADRTRRIEVAVGVAYGTEPDRVIEVLKRSLEGQEGLLTQPAPQILFSGFGDNSLDFILRAWVADNDDFLSVRSSIALAVNRCLNENGIEIPFPQRDLHLRSISPNVSLPGSG